jgi:hypothetical protein
MPWKISKREDKFCVVKSSDGSVEKCHATKEKAQKHMAALYASEGEKAAGVDVKRELSEEEVVLSPPTVESTGSSPDEALRQAQDAEKAITESEIVSSWVPWGVTSFDELDDVQDARATSQHISSLTRQFTDLTYNIVEDSDISDKSGAVKALTDEFTRRLDEATDEFSPKEKGLIERITTEVKSWFGKEETPQDPQPFSIVKAADGTYRWLAIYSNNYRDDDGIPEILSAEAHKDFVKAVDSGEWPQPELWYWHVPMSSMGKSTMVAYDEAAGFAVASGVFNEGMESVAESLQKKSDLAVSHGMPVSEIERDADDPTIITRYRSREISFLPLKAAANKLTGSFITSKEDDSMAIDDTKLQALVELGFDVETLTSTVEEAKTQAESEQRESKELPTEEEVETKDEVEELETEVEVVSEVEQVEAESEVETDEGEGKEVTPDPDTQSALEFANFLKEVVAEAVAPLNERLDNLEAQKQTEEQEAKEEQLLDEYTPAVSFAALIRSAVLGKEETQVDGRTKEAQGPVQTEVPTRSRTGLPVNTFIDTMLEGGDWRDGMGIEKN